MKVGKAMKKGFTLVELLVVISIIAMLLAILIPSLNNARLAARSTVCRASLKQLGAAGMMYTIENNGSFQLGRKVNKQSAYVAWKPYYKDDKLWLCPMAVKTKAELGNNNIRDNTFVAWGKFDGASKSSWDVKDGYGSVGSNEWVSNPPPGGEVAYRDPKNFFRSIPTMKNCYNIPLIGDCSWIGGVPDNLNDPPKYQGENHSDDDNYQMTRFCMNRHKKQTAMVFADGSARLVGLKELWRLKWHKSANTALSPQGLPLWRIEAPWMAGFPDFGPR
jgi:prepilin-type N-terminal cleavage/methylation domain-containing protein